jgi:hypothetical protein
MKFVAQHADDLRGEGFVQHPDGLCTIELIILCHRAILHRLTRPLPDLFDMLEKAHALSLSSRPAYGALAPRPGPSICISHVIMPTSGAPHPVVA